MSNIDKVRAKISALQAGRVEIESAPPARDEIAAGLQSHLERSAADRAGMLRRALAAEDFDAVFRVPSRTGAVDSTDALAGLLGVPELMRLMQPHLMGLPEGMTIAHRRKKLAEIDAELLKAENQEQDVIDAAEREGVALAYRADARPEIVLRAVRQ